MLGLIGVTKEVVAGLVIVIVSQETSFGIVLFVFLSESALTTMLKVNEKTIYI